MTHSQGETRIIDRDGIYHTGLSSIEAARRLDVSPVTIRRMASKIGLVPDKVECHGVGYHLYPSAKVESLRQLLGVYQLRGGRTWAPSPELLSRFNLP